jgi:hypothetical protein
LSGTAITIVAPIDGKSVAAIERLIGQTIPWMGEPAAPAEARESRPREGARAPRPQRREPQPKPHAEKRHPRSAQAPRPQPPREATEDSDGSHLPAFLLRPVSLKA